MSEAPSMLEEIASVMRRHGFRDIRFPVATSTPDISDGSISFQLNVTALLTAETVVSMDKAAFAELQNLDAQIKG